MSVDLMMDYNEAEKAGGFIVDDDNYQVQVKSFEHGKTQAGRPKLVFHLEITDPAHPDACGKVLWHNCPLPWNDPEKGGDKVTSGIGLLTSLCEATGYEWEGTEFDEEQLLGRTCIASVYQDVYEGKTNNKIKKLFPSS